MSKPLKTIRFGSDLVKALNEFMGDHEGQSEESLAPAPGLSEERKKEILETMRRRRAIEEED